MGGKGTKTIRCLLVILLAVWICFVWSNSMDNDNVSSGKSSQVMKFINEWVSKPVSEHFVRKAAHFAEYAVEGIIVAAVIFVFKMSVWQSAFFTSVLLTFTPVIDETIQMFSTGRNSSIVDVWIDMSGYAFGYAVMTLLIVIKEVVRSKMSVSKAQCM